MARHTSPIPPTASRVTSWYRSRRRVSGVVALTGTSLVQHRLHDRLGDGRCEAPAADVVGVLGPVLDHDGHRNLGVLRGCERREPGVRLGALAVLRGSGLAGDLDAVDLGPLPGPVIDHG